MVARFNDGRNLNFEITYQTFDKSHAAVVMKEHIMYENNTEMRRDGTRRENTFSSLHWNIKDTLWAKE